jgi:hypothetical protein
MKKMSWSPEQNLQEKNNRYNSIQGVIMKYIILSLLLIGLSIQFSPAQVDPNKAVVDAREAEWKTCATMTLNALDNYYSTKPQHQVLLDICSHVGINETNCPMFMAHVDGLGQMEALINEFIEEKLVKTCGFPPRKS